MKVDPERLQSALDGLENEIRLLRFLVYALFERANPADQAAVLTRFRGCVAEVPNQAPPGTDSEIVVDLLARAEIHARELRATMRPD
jgi:hypothetical protein